MLEKPNGWRFCLLCSAWSYQSHPPQGSLIVYICLLGLTPHQDGARSHCQMCTTVSMSCSHPAPSLTQDDFNNQLWNVVMLAMGGSALGEAVKSSGLLESIAHSIEDVVAGTVGIHSPRCCTPHVQHDAVEETEPLQCLSVLTVAPGKGAEAKYSVSLYHVSCGSPSHRQR